jgi:hypothetical protein
MGYSEHDENEVFETSIDSLGERTYFACNDEEMTTPLNLEVKMPRSLDAIGVHLGSVDLKNFHVDSNPCRPKWCHRICNLEDNLGNVLTTGCIYAYLQDEVFVMDEIGPVTLA